MTIIRAIWLALMFVLFGFRVRFGFDDRKVYLHIGRHRVTEPVSLVVHPRGYRVIADYEMETTDRQDAFMSAFIELNKFA